MREVECGVRKWLRTTLPATFEELESLRPTVASEHEKEHEMMGAKWQRMRGREFIIGHFHLLRTEIRKDTVITPRNVRTERTTLSDQRAQWTD